MDARTLSSQDLLLDASDRKHTSSEGHLSCHCDTALDLLSAICGHHRAHHRDAGRRTVLRNRSFRHMDMYILLDELLICKAGHFRMRLDVLERDLGRFLHHVSEVSCHGQIALSLADRALDEEDLSSHRCPCKSGNDSGSLISLLHVMRVSRKAEIFPEVFLLDCRRILLFQSYLLGCHTSHLCDLLLKSTNSGLMCIFIYDLRHSALLKLQLSLLETMLLDLLRHKIILRDLILLLSEITAHIDHLHTVLEGRLDSVDAVCSRDEHHVRQIVIYVEIVVMEGCILLRIKSFKESRRRIALHILGKLVDLVKDYHRV